MKSWSERGKREEEKRTFCYQRQCCLHVAPRRNVIIAVSDLASIEALAMFLTDLVFGKL